MKIDEVNKIEQTYNQEKVNELLAKGYKIIKIFSTKQSVEDSEEIKPCYIMGLGIEKKE